MYNSKWLSQFLLNKSAQVEVKIFTLFVQFKRIQSTEEEHAKLMDLVEQFQQFNKPNKHLIFHILLAATNHWVVLTAHRFNDTIEFLLQDSKREDYLDWNLKEIHAQVNAFYANIEVEGKLSRQTTFIKGCDISFYSDAQVTVFRLCDLLLGNINLEQFIVNINFAKIHEGFQAYVLMDGLNDFLKTREKHPSCTIFIENFCAWLDKIYYLIEELATRYKKNLPSLLVPSNQGSWKEMIEVLLIFLAVLKSDPGLASNIRILFKSVESNLKNLEGLLESIDLKREVDLKQSDYNFSCCAHLRSIYTAMAQSQVFF